MVGPVVERALFLVPGGAFVVVDDAVVIGVDLVEALAEATVALGHRHRREKVVIRLLPLEPGATLRVQILFGELGGNLELPFFDKVEPPIAVGP